MLSHDQRDVDELVKFVTEKPRMPSEIQGLINNLAHEKYHYDGWGRGTGKGHALRMHYKSWLKRKLHQRLYRLERAKKYPRLA